MRDLSRDERMLLLALVCSFAWADRIVRPEERSFIEKLARRLDLDRDERLQVDAWLESPPPSDAADPARVPAEHRTRFLRTLESVIAVDGEIAESERRLLLHVAKALHSR